MSHISGMNSLTAPLPTTTHRKAFALELKSVEDAHDGIGKFSGIASAVGVVDLHGEVIEAGAFDATLAQKSTVPLLWQHNTSLPIGVIHLSTDMRGDLIGAGEINLETQLGREAHALVKQGAVGAMSIGFNVPEGALKWDADAKVVRILSVDMWETSLVTFPANPSATITDVKHAASAELDAVKAGKVLSAANLQKVKDARDALDAVIAVAEPDAAATKSIDVGHQPDTTGISALKALVAEITGETA